MIYYYAKHNKHMSNSDSLELEALKWAKYLDNMLRRVYMNELIPILKDVPSEFLSDYWSGFNEGEGTELEDDISARDVVFGPNYTKKCNEVEGENILYRGSDDYFEYTKTKPNEVIALGKGYRFLDLNLPINDIECCSKSDYYGLYASKFTNKYGSFGEVNMKYKHLNFAFNDVCITYSNGSFMDNDESSFYKIYFCGEDLINFIDLLYTFRSIEEHISQVFLEDSIDRKYENFTMFSIAEDVFTIEQVPIDNVY